MRAKDLSEIVLKFKNGKYILDKTLGVQRGVLNKRGLGYKPFIKAKYLKNYFVKASTSNESNITCNYCGNKGHISSSCPIQKKYHIGTKKSVGS